mmetsp:Transcript_121274/g.343610  ORF Transcript_121274/g.343610 Transcript_121274/m.343610 type:complete len:427 (+) Transcript_121274:101-1381(+)
MPKLVGTFSALCAAAWCVPVAGAAGWAAPRVTLPRVKLPRFGAPQRAAAPPKFSVPAVPVPAFRMPGSARKPAALPKRGFAPVPELAGRRLQAPACDYDLGNAIGAIIGMAVYYGLAHAVDTASTFHYMCDEMPLVERCQAAAPGECYGGCELGDDGTCGPLWVTGARWYIEPEPSSPLALYGGAVEYCNSLSPAACGSNGRCEWKADSMKCDLSGEMFVHVVCNESFAPLLGAMTECGALASEADCGGEPTHCSWNGAACEVAALRFAQLAFGEGPGGEFYGRMQYLVPGDCEGDGRCAAFVEQMGTCSQYPEASCAGDCTFAGGDCEVSLAATESFCGGGGVTCGEVKELYRANACCGMPEKVVHTERRLQRSSSRTPGGRPPRTEEALLRRVTEAVQAEMAGGGKFAARRLTDQISEVLAGWE